MTTELALTPAVRARQQLHHVTQVSCGRIDRFFKTIIRVGFRVFSLSTTNEASSAQHCTDDTSNNIRYPELSLAIGIPDGPVEKKMKKSILVYPRKKKKTSRKRIQIYGLPKDKSWYTINTYLDASLSCLVFLLNDLGLGR